MFIGLNPSTAEEVNDDPTIRRCVVFSKNDSFLAVQLKILFFIRSLRSLKFKLIDFPNNVHGISVNLTIILNMSNTTVISNWNFARDFPSLGTDQVLRPHLLETIVDILNNTPIVFLEGEEGDGATTTLAQFCIRYPDQTFSLFIKPASRFSYSVEYVRLALAEQFYWYVHGVPFDKDTIDEAEYKSLIYKVRRKKRNLTLYVVVDGLHQVPADDFRRVEEIFRDVLPLGVDNFRFIIVGQQENFKRINIKLACKPYQQLKFRPEDTEQFLADLSLSKDNVTEIHKICKSIPGRIASVKRLLNTGVSLEDVMSSEPSKYLEFIKLEFNSIDKLTEEENLAIAIVTFSKRPLLVSEIEEMISSTIDFPKLWKTCTFLAPILSKNFCNFVSEAHRKFAEKRFEPLQKKTLSMQIDYLLLNPTSENALIFLPTYYQQLNKQQAILDLISPEHYTRLFDSTNSISALRNRAELAMQSASVLKETTEIFKFALQKSIFVAVGTQKVRESEVAALVAMHQTERALSLANQAKIKEDRLALLATYSKGIKEKGGALDNTLVVIIKDLSAEIDFTEHPDRAVEIASDILFFDADLAIEIVEKANKRSASAKEKDAAFFRMSVSATMGNSASGAAFGTKSGHLISDAALQKFTASLTAFTERMPISEVIQIAEQMPVGQRIYFLRSVVDVRRKYPKILDLVDYALDVLIKETAYTPKSIDLAELSIPLPIAIASMERLEHLIDRFDAQIGLIAKSAFSKDLALLQMRLAKAQIKINQEKACERIAQSYYDVASIKTPEIQAECYTIMLSLIGGMDNIESIEKEHGFKSVIKNDLELVTEVILKHTADHFTAVEGVLRSLARHDEDAAFDLAKSLNTEHRRNRAYGTVVRSIGKLPFSEERKKNIFFGISKILDQYLKDDAILSIYKAIERNLAKTEWVDKIAALKNMISSTEIACECAIIEVRIKSSTTDSVVPIDHIPALIDRIDAKLTAIDLNFSASAALSVNQKEDALKFFDTAQKMKDTLLPHSDAAFEILIRCIYLIVRISQPLMKAGIFDDEKYLRICTLIDSIPCSLTQAEMYADMAARAWCANRSDLNKKISQERCIPIAESAKKSKDISLYNNIIRMIFPIIRTYHSATAFELLNQLPKSLASDALYDAALLIIRRIAPAEPYHSMEFDRFQLESSDILDLYSILEKQSSDADFYYTLAAAVDAISSKTNKLIFTIQQKTDFAVKCQKIINSILPDKNNILHNGYKISATAQVYRLTDNSYQNWLDLINETNKIENSADRGYVYLELFKCIPKKYDADRKQILAEALLAFDAIPSPIDRLSHYENYATAASRDSTSTAKDVLKRAVLLSSDLDNSIRVEKHRRQLIDIADKIDPGLANELIELIDDDPARAHAKSDLKKSAEVAKVSRSIANAKSISEVEPCGSVQLAKASWTNFSKLVCGRLESKSLEVMTQHLLNIKNCSITESYSTLTWYIENLSRRFSRTQDLEAHTVPLCEALLLSTEMASSIIRQSYSKVNNHIVDATSQSNAFIVNPGDRGAALDYIKNWIGSNSEEYIKFCDPYFGPEDLSFLKMILSDGPLCKVSILTSISYLKEKGARTVDVFQEEWNRISDQDPPQTEIIAIGTDVDEKSLFHDRWLLTKGAGLRIGTSFNSIGISKISEISEMESLLAGTHEHNLDRYFHKQKMIDGNKFSYWTFDL